MGKKKLICVVGPTASGKTSLAISLCRRLNGEVVSCDSMQIYQGMTIGTAKPSKEEQAGVAHHMIDIVAPWEEYSAARYGKEAGDVLLGLFQRGKLPVVAGGTGLYLNALISGVNFAGKSEDPALRAGLNELPQEELMERLQACDPESAARLHPRDRKRIIRALEVFLITGKTITEYHALSKQVESPYSTLKIGLCYTPRQKLYQRIEDRVDQMISDGWLEETDQLLRGGTPPGATAMQAIGYRELQQVLSSALSLSEAVLLIKQNTRRYAKRQLSWFRRDPEIHWLDLGELSWEQVQQYATEWAQSFLNGREEKTT